MKDEQLIRFAAEHARDEALRLQRIADHEVNREDKDHWRALARDEQTRMETLNWVLEEVKP